MEIIFNSRCLNKRGRPPVTGLEYELFPGLLANYIAQLLRQGAGQQEVWGAIEHQKGDIILRSVIPARVDKF